MYYKLSSTCEELKFRGWYDAAFRLGQENILFRYFSNSSKLVELRSQSQVCEVKMLAVWPSIAEGFPTDSQLAVGNPSAIEGQTAIILTSRTGLWAGCSTSLLEFEKYLKSIFSWPRRNASSYRPRNLYLNSSQPKMSIYFTYESCKLSQN